MRTALVLRFALRIAAYNVVRIRIVEMANRVEMRSVWPRAPTALTAETDSCAKMEFALMWSVQTMANVLMVCVRITNASGVVLPKIAPVRTVV